MRVPKAPPPLDRLLEEVQNVPPAKLFDAFEPLDHKGRYLHWEEIRYRQPPEGLDRRQWWTAIKLARKANARILPLRDKTRKPFWFANVDPIQEMTHQIDQIGSGNIALDSAPPLFGGRSNYVVSSLMEEAIASSQLEGASTSREDARAMLEAGREPRPGSERMIANNFRALEAVRDLAEVDEPLSPTRVLEIHRIVTEGTLEQRHVGRLQTDDDNRVKVYSKEPNGPVLHVPPPAIELPERLERLCEFANDGLPSGFLHPIVKAIILHFALAYDHPFQDGNGRTARSLFYWSLLRSGYWMVQYLPSISTILRKRSTKYSRSYLHVESDDGDVTYFILFQLEVILGAVDEFAAYLRRKAEESRQLERRLHGSDKLNYRQKDIILSALKNSHAEFTIAAHRGRHRVSYPTARGDLLDLAESGLLKKRQAGKRFAFSPSPDLQRLLGSMNP